MRRSLILGSLALAALAAHAQINVTTPVAGQSLTSPIYVAADSTLCDGVKTIAMGISLDYGATTITDAQQASGLVIAGLGEHTVHVKCWGPHNVVKMVDVPVTVADLIPTTATAVAHIEQQTNWREHHDPATGSGSTSSGTTEIVGLTRRFDFDYTHRGGELFSVHVGKDPNAQHFVYDAELMIPDATDIANVEMDLNQVTANGQTVIMGFQCDGWSGTWDYTENAGTPAKPSDHWLRSSAPCNPRDWTKGAWHHIQISYEHDQAGNVTYHTVVFDGVEQQIDKAVLSSFALHWSIGSMVANFQLDGDQRGSGSATAYLQNFTIYRW